MVSFSYPPAARLDLTETLHGRAISDPYRWLEDPDTPAAQDWLQAEDELYASYLAGLTARRERFASRLTELLAAGTVGTPAWRGDRQFYTRREAGQEHAVLYTATATASQPDGAEADGAGADGAAPDGAGADRASPDGAGADNGAGPGGRAPTSYRGGRRAGADRPDGGRPVRRHHDGQLAARPRGSAAGLPAIGGRPGGVCAAGHGRRDRGRRGRPHRPVPFHRGGLAARRRGVLLQPQARPGRGPGW